jgi:hypothetical protein
MYTSFTHAPDKIALAHPFGVGASGTTAGSLGSLANSRHIADEGDDEGKNEDNLMLTKMDGALAVELFAEHKLDEADARGDAAYEGCEGRGGNDADGIPLEILGTRGSG